MRWAIDVGNTNTKIARESAAEAFEEVARIPTGRLDAELSGVLQAAGLRGSLVAIACVVPSAIPVLEEALRGFGARSRFLSASSAPGLAIRYETPETLGADRVANALFLSASGALPAIAVDCGSAVKLDAVDGEGAFLGGAILPSAQMMLDGLAIGTAQLPQLSPGSPLRAIGRSTEQCLQAGTVLALAKAVEGLIAEFQLDLGPRVRVVGTGGALETIRPWCPSLVRQEPHMAARGLLIAARRWDSST